MLLQYIYFYYYHIYVFINDNIFIYFLIIFTPRVVDLYTASRLHHLLICRSLLGDGHGARLENCSLPSIYMHIVVGNVHGHFNGIPNSMIRFPKLLFIRWNALFNFYPILTTLKWRCKLYMGTLVNLFVL